MTVTPSPYQPRQRHFSNFIKAYCEYTDDSFTPPQFNEWVAMSIIAAALERKVWLPWSDTFNYYPNIYVLLVTTPGIGKSVALNRGVDLLREMNAIEGRMHVIPSQVTEAKFIELMSQARPFQYGSKIINQSAGYYYASEASNSLRNIYGDFIACLTDFYDCPKVWEKATLKDDKITIRNCCLNLLAGSTFDYLNKLITAESIMGGFASRMIYVLEHGKTARKQDFQLGVGVNSEERAAFRRKLIEDLRSIHSLVGPYSATEGYARSWERWYADFEERRVRTESEKLQSLMVRGNTNAIKISMILSAATGNDLLLKEEHWHEATSLIDSVEKELPTVFRAGQAGNTQEQSGVTQAIFMVLSEGITDRRALRMRLLSMGHNVRKVDETLTFMSNNGAIRSAGNELTLLVNPNDYF